MRDSIPLNLKINKSKGGRLCAIKTAASIMSSALSPRLSREKGESDSLYFKGCVLSFVNWGDLAYSHGDAP